MSEVRCEVYASWKAHVACGLSGRALRHIACAIGLFAAMALSQAANATCPYTFDTTSIANGNTADASPVMNNFNYILNCPNFLGNVGIGTATPAAPLSVYGTNTIAEFTGPYVQSMIRFKSNAGSYRYIGSDDSTNFNIYASDGSTKEVTINNSGNVGIGTTSPFSQLSNTANNTIDAGSGGINTGAFSWVMNQPGYAAAVYNANTSGSGLLIKGAANGGYSLLSVDQGTSQGVAGTALFRVLGDGNVGIGTTNPFGTIDAESATGGFVLANTSATADGQTAMLSLDPGGAFLNSTYWNKGPSIAGIFEGSSTASGLAFYTYNGNQIQVMRISANGNVGIGTTAPDLMLSVNGDADKASGGSAWSMFSDHRLKDIEGNYTRGLEDIVRLQPIRFHYKANNPLRLPSNTNEVGVVAQDVETVFPEAVHKGKDGYLEFNMSPVQFAMINAIRELKAENDRERATVAGQQKELRENATQLRTDAEAIRALQRANMKILTRLERLERSKLARAN